MDSAKRTGYTGGVATAAGGPRGAGPAGTAAGGPAGTAGQTTGPAGRPAVDSPPGGSDAGAPTGGADVAAAAGSADPEVGLRAVAALRVLTERLEILQVDNARRLGWSWQEIAERLGVTKQTVHRKHGGRSREQR